MTTSTPRRSDSLFQLAVIVSALGFFVDVYDLLLFGIVRKASLADLGLSPEKVFTTGETIISVQMIGLLIGGIIWGIIGDKKGRLKVLFGSILLYSIANILNGMVKDIPQYIILRFIAGVGLAGELGAGITLVSELLPKEKRGIAAAMIASFGIFGAVTAFFTHEIFQDWRLCYYIGGGLGLVLLLLRVSVYESTLYNEVKTQHVQRGNFLMFFTKKKIFLKYARCILIGIPAWYIIGVLVTFSDQFAKEMGINGVDPGKAIMYQYMAIAFGDMSAGLLSQWLRSRKKALFIFYGITALFTTLYFLQDAETSVDDFYWICAGLGYGTGFSVMYITMSAEQFGTNLRASAAISIPNMVRGALPLILLLFKFTRSLTDSIITGAWITGVMLMAIAILAAWKTEETFGKDLNFLEF